MFIKNLKGDKEMKVVNVNGVIMEIKRIKPLVQSIAKVGNHQVLLNITAKKGDKPNAIKVVTKSNNNFIVGNLSLEQYYKIKKALLEKDYFDFSHFMYQPAKTIDKLVIDNGVSSPYCSDITQGISDTLTSADMENIKTMDDDDWEEAYGYGACPTDDGFDEEDDIDGVFGEP